MKTLKKALCLVLCLSMVLSLGVIGASAAYTDAAEISEDYAAAVEVLSGMGVISGKTDGSFDPDGTFTRAAAATLICKALKVSDNLLAAATSTFTDISGNWAEDYIAYLAQEKIVSGKGDGTFGPTDELSSYALAVMLCKAYKVDITSDTTYSVSKPNGDVYVTGNKAEADAYAKAGCTVVEIPSNWKLDVTKAVATQNDKCPTGKVFMDLDLVTKGTITREEASEMIWEAVLCNSGYGAGKGVWKLTAAADTDEFGNPSTKYTNGETAANKKVEYATVADAAVATYTTNVKVATIYADAGLTATSDTRVYVAGGASAGTAVSVSKTSTDYLYGTGVNANGTVTKVYGTKNGITKIVSIETTIQEVGTISKVAATSAHGEYTLYTIGGTGYKAFNTVVDKTKDIDEIVITGEIKTGDNVLVTKGNGKYVEVVKAETIEGAVSAISSKGVYTIGGAEKELAAGYVGDKPAISKTEGTYYVDAYGYVIKAAAAAPASTALLISVDYAQALVDSKIKTTYSAVVAATDGTVSTIAINETSFNAYATAENKCDYTKCGVVVKYSENAKGENVLTTTGVTAPAIDTLKTGDNSLKMSDASIGIVANDKTLYVVVNYKVAADGVTRIPDGTVTLTTGYANAPTYTTLNKACAVDTDKNADKIANVVYVYDDVAATATTKYVYVTGAYTQTAASKYTTVAIVDGQPTDLTTDAVLAKGMYKSVASTNTATASVAVAAGDIACSGTSASVKVSGGVLSINGTPVSGVTVANDAPVYVINATDATATTLAASDLSSAVTYETQGAKDTADGFQVLYSTSADGKSVTAIYIVVIPA